MNVKYYIEISFPALDFLLFKVTLCVLTYKTSKLASVIKFQSACSRGAELWQLDMMKITALVQLGISSHGTW